MKKTIERIIAFSLIISMLIPVISFADIIGVDDKAKSIFTSDISGENIIYDKDSDTPYAIASLTKLMTFLLVDEAIKNKSIDKSTEVTITQDVQDTGGSSMNLKLNEKVTVDDLLKGLMVVSGNDAALALAKVVKKTEAEFVKEMNKKSAELGLKSAVFQNSSGLPVNGKDNLMSAKDLFKLSKYLLEKHPDVLYYSSIRILDMPSRQFRKSSTIPLIGSIPGVDGLKTGTTDAAGYCLISTMQKKDGKPFRVISISLGSKSIGDRNLVNKTILDYINTNYKYKTVTDPDALQGKVNIPSSIIQSVEYYPSEKIEMMVDSSKGIDYKTNFDKSIKAPLKAGTKIGTLVIEPNGKSVHKVDLIVKKDYNKATLGTRVRRTMSYIFNLTRTLLYI